MGSAASMTQATAQTTAVALQDPVQEEITTMMTTIVLHHHQRECRPTFRHPQHQCHSKLLTMMSTPHATGIGDERHRGAARADGTTLRLRTERDTRGLGQRGMGMRVMRGKI